MNRAVHNFASLGAGVAFTTTGKVTFTLDPSRAYRFARGFAVRKSGAAASAFQFTLSTTSGLANAAAALTDLTDGYVGQAGASGAPGTVQRAFASDADQRWFVPNADGEVYLYMFPDASGDFFVYRFMFESFPLAK